MDRETFERYFEAFNARDYDTLHRDYFAPDVKLYTLGYVLEGQQAVKAFYRFFHDYIDEKMSCLDFHPTRDGFFAEAGMRLTAKKDLTPAVLAEYGFERLPPIPQGSVYETVLFIRYVAKDNRFSEIRCAEFIQPQAA